MKWVLLTAAVVLAGMPADAYDVRCRTYSSNGYAETTCTDGLFDDEIEESNRQYRREMRAVLKGQGLPPTFCEDKAQAIYDYRLKRATEPWDGKSFAPPRKPTRQSIETEWLYCNSAAKKGEAREWWRLNDPYGDPLAPRPPKPGEPQWRYPQMESFKN